MELNFIFSFTALYSLGYILCYINNNMDNKQIFDYISILVAHSVKLQEEIQNLQQEVKTLINRVDNQALAVEKVLEELMDQ